MTTEASDILYNTAKGLATYMKASPNDAAEVQHFKSKNMLLESDLASCVKDIWDTEHHKLAFNLRAFLNPRYCQTPAMLGTAVAVNPGLFAPLKGTKAGHVMRESAERRTALEQSLMFGGLLIAYIEAVHNLEQLERLHPAQLCA